MLISMKPTAFILFLLLLLPNMGYAQEMHFVKHDYAEIGLSFLLPANWEHDGLNTTTKAAFIKEFGWNYDKPDANDIWNAFGSFSSISIDSTLLPNDAAFEMHKMTIFVNRAQTMYRQWLCKQRRENILDSKPLINNGFALVKEDWVRSVNLPRNLPDASAKSYQYYTGEVYLLTQGHVYTFIHQDKCYEIKIESTTSDPTGSIRLHERIINSLERYSF